MHDAQNAWVAGNGDHKYTAAKPQAMGSKKSKVALAVGRLGTPVLLVLGGIVIATGTGSDIVRLWTH